MSAASFLENPRTRVDRNFVRFHAENPHVYEEIKKRATNLAKAGVKRIGIAAIYESIRYDAAIKTLSLDYKMNDNYKARYARLLIQDHPEFASLIQLRRINRSVGGQ